MWNGFSWHSDGPVTVYWVYCDEALGYIKDKLIPWRAAKLSAAPDALRSIAMFLWFIKQLKVTSQFQVPAALPLWEIACYPSEKRLGWPPRRSEYFHYDKKLLPLSGLKLQAFGRP
jgi:hypothetical protein